jgi:hypothetical protein
MFVAMLRVLCVDNLLAWAVWGIGFELFACVMLWRHYYCLNQIHLLRHSLNTIITKHMKRREDASDFGEEVYADVFEC